MLRSKWTSRQWANLRDGWDRFPWKAALLRMLADLVSVNVSMVLAFVLWYFFYILILKDPQPEALAQRFKKFAINYALLWSSLALLVFHLHGFYTRTRAYVRRYKALVVLRAVTLFVIAFVFANYFVYRGALAPRGVALLSWFLLLATVGGSRFALHQFMKLQQTDPKRPARKPEHVLVVGGAGYLGSVLVPMLLERGYRTRVLDSLLFGKTSLRPVENHSNCEVILGDVRDIQAVVQAMKGCDAVIDLAAIVGDPACEENRQLATEINRAATRMLVEVCRGYGIQRFLFASTCSVYGASEFLMDEHSQVAPISLYAQTKADSESLLLDAKCAEFHPTILRLATLFGMSPRPRFDLVVNLLTARAIRMGKITIFNGEQWRPFMHVHDAARGFLTCLEANISVVSGEIFNAGSYESNHRLSEVAEKIFRTIPNVEVEHMENEDRRSYRVSFDKIHSRLGFVCERSLEDGIRELAEMVQESHIEDFFAETFNNRAMVKLYAQSSAATQSSIRLLETLTRAE